MIPPKSSRIGSDVNRLVPNFAQAFVHFAVVPNPNSATFVFETNRPCQPNVDVFPLATASAAVDMEDQKVIAGNALANIATPAGNRHVFRVPRRWIPGKPHEGAQLETGKRYRFRVTAPPDSEAVAHGYHDSAVIHGEFSTGSRNGAVVVSDLNVFRAGDPHHFGLTVGDYRDSDGLAIGSQLSDKFDTNDDPLNFDNSNGSFRDPFKGKALAANQASDKLQFYALGWGPNRSALSTAPFRSVSFFEAPAAWPDTPDHGEDDNGPWATAVGFVDLPDWSLPGVVADSFDGASQNAAAFARNPKTSFLSTLLLSLDSGNFGVHYQIDLSIGVTVLPPADLPSIDGPAFASRRPGAPEVFKDPTLKP